MSRQALRRAGESGLRRLTHFYARFARGMTLGVRGLVLRDDGAVFLVKHSYVSGWHLPGGGVETGETVRQALDRELREEGNIEPLAPPELWSIYFNTSASPRDHVALFVIRTFRQERAPTPGREIIGHGFFLREALPADATPGTRRRIAEVLDGAPVSERW